jgi:tetratricopeptide (TPR) repeat protein
MGQRIAAATAHDHARSARSRRGLDAPTRGSGIPEIALRREISRHTCSVLRAALLGLAIAAATAHADDKPQPRSGSGEPTFWRDVLYPHRDEVDTVLARCRTALDELDTAELADAAPPAAARRQLAVELEGALRYARKLEPDNSDVLQMLGRVADEAGDARVARDALSDLVNRVGEDHAGADALDRIGAAAIDAGHYDDAIHALRLAQVSVYTSVPAGAHALVHLATALALAGRNAAAIDVLGDALPPQASFEPNELALVGFALAVQYDRDEERSAAFDILDRMKQQLGDQLAPSLQNALARMRFAPAEDELYYRALMAEVIGDWSEARTEWLLYAADDAAPYRRRAIDHAHAIDRLPRESKSTPQITLPQIQLLFAPPPPPPQQQQGTP